MFLMTGWGDVRRGRGTLSQRFDFVMLGRLRTDKRRMLLELRAVPARKGLTNAMAPCALDVRVSVLWILKHSLVRRRLVADFGPREDGARW